MVTGVGAVTHPTMTPVNNGGQMSTAAEPPKRSSDNRRSNKPIMEKRRRARINNCLNELKALILDATKKDPARHSKLEKADILEKTVKHLQDLQRQQSALTQSADPNVVNKFKAGFVECANEVGRFPGLDASHKKRLLQHLSNCINGVKNDHQQQPNIDIQILPSPPSSPEQDQQTIYTQSNSNHNSGYYLTNRVQVKLPNGNIAYVTPQSPASLATALPLLVPIPSRTASTGSAASSSSSGIYDRLSQDNVASPQLMYASPSPSASGSNVYEQNMDASTDCQYNRMQETPSPSFHRGRNHSHSYHPYQYNAEESRSYSPVPLSLVMKKTTCEEEDKDDEKPWRPW